MSRRDRHRRRRRNSGGGASRAVFLTMGVLSATAVIGVLAAVGWILGIAASAPDIKSLKPVNPGASSVVYAADGQRLGFIQADILRTPIGSSLIPTSVKNATVSIEDKRFYSHKGVDIEGIVRAGVKNVTSGKTVQGGSTLTMQLVKNLYDAGKKRTFKRKIQEAKLAEDLENLHPGHAGKVWILNKYLNEVPYGTVGGQTALGIQAAARVYFNKPAAQLTLPEAALLAGLPQAPSQFNPFLDPAAAMRRRNQVLRAMVVQHKIRSATAAAAEQAPLGVKHSRYYTTRREGYFFDYVKDQLIKRYGLNEVRKGGLRIETTIDLKLQKVARQAIANRLPYPTDPSAAVVSMQPYTGHIVAMASSAKYANSKFNLAAQGHRQPGSAFKIMVLMSLIRRGVDPKTTTYDSKPLHFFDSATGTQIDVQTDDHRYSGRTTLFEGLVKSDNTVYQQADLDAGPVEVTKTAHDMGIVSHLDSYPAEGLGGMRFGVSPLEMARAYATVANGGWRVRPVSITKVTFPDGRVDTKIGQPDRVKVFTDGQTNAAIQAMEANVQRGTGTAAQISCPVAGKTGTTSAFTDAWFDGFTPHLVTAVWVGYPKQTISMTSVHGIQVFGGTFPAQIWHDFMSVAVGNHCAQFPTPKVPFVAAPFFGKYATTGAPGKGVDKNQVYTGPGSAPSGNGGSKPGKKKAPGGKGTNNAKKKYPPSLYQSPPQPPPKVQPPPTTPTTGGGGGTTGGGTAGTGGGAAHGGGRGTGG